MRQLRLWRAEESSGRKAPGQSVVEFALVLPIFILLIAGIFDLGRGVASYSLLANCAREGARAGIFPQSSDADIMTAVNSQTLFLGSISSSSVTITPSTQSARTSGSNLTVQVQYVFQPFTALIGIPSTLTLKASSTMLIE